MIRRAGPAAKVAGLARYAGELGETTPGQLFRADVHEIVLTSLNEAGTMLRIEAWRPGKGRRLIERA